LIWYNEMRKTTSNK